MSNNPAKYIIVVGVAIVFIGLILMFNKNAFSWFGRLPGDIRIEKKNFRFYFPIVTMLLISAVITFLINIFKKLW
jgi:H+/Cl- antiporter ClcA